MRAPPSGSKFFHFLAFCWQKMQNNRLAHPLRELAPPQENPESATVDPQFFPPPLLLVLTFMLTLII